MGLSWTAPTSTTTTITGYRIERSTGSTGWAAVETNAKGTIYTDDTGLTANTVYAYRVAAINAAGLGPWSPVARARTGAARPSLTATGRGPTTVTLTWTPASTYLVWSVRSYEIEQSTNGTNWNSLVADTGSAATTYTHTGFPSGTATYFRVTARYAHTTPILPFTPQASNVASAIPTTVAPTGVAVTPAPHALHVTWDAVPEAAAYLVEWREEDGYGDDTAQEHTVLVGSVNPATYTHTISSLPAGVSYTVRVRVTTWQGGHAVGPWSKEATATPTPPAGVTAPATPVITLSNSDNNDNKVEVSWSVPENIWATVQWKSGAQDYSRSRSLTQSFSSRWSTHSNPQSSAGKHGVHGTGAAGEVDAGATAFSCRRQPLVRRSDDNDGGCATGAGHGRDRDACP